MGHSMEATKNEPNLLLHVKNGQNDLKETDCFSVFCWLVRCCYNNNNNNSFNVSHSRAS